MSASRQSRGDMEREISNLKASIQGWEDIYGKLQERYDKLFRAHERLKLQLFDDEVPL